jgi:hypothetical protein
MPSGKQKRRTVVYHDFSYPAVLAASGRRTAWTIDEILPDSARFDFSRPFLPEALARVERVPGLSASERLMLNHIRGHEYLSLFGLVEKFILPFLEGHMRDGAAPRDDRLRALEQFTVEEAKHIALFQRFQARFAAAFPVACAVIGPAEAIVAEVLRHDPLSVALLTLHLEWMTQSHYLDSVRDDAGIDPLFASLLRNHWIEEAQHAKLDTLIVERIAAPLSPAAIERAIEGYLELGAFFDAGFRTQTELNLVAFERAIGRTLDGGAHQAFLDRQHQALRWTYLGSGMTHPNFGATLTALSPAMRARVDAIAPAFC